MTRSKGMTPDEFWGLVEVGERRTVWFTQSQFEDQPWCITGRVDRSALYPVEDIRVFRLFPEVEFTISDFGEKGVDDPSPWELRIEDVLGVA